MVVRLTIYIEGGGAVRSSGSLAAQARQMFTKFLKDRCRKTVLPRVKFYGGRDQAFKEFCKAKKADEECLLLVDAEDPVNNQLGPWDQPRIKNTDKWEKPANATDDDLHFMASTMEAWLVANPDVLKAYFKDGFKPAKLPQSPNLEKVSKPDVYSGLKAATGASDKGPYGKGPDSFKLLAQLDPEMILKRCPYWSKRFCDELKKRGLK